MSLLERARQLHEDIERGEKVAARLLHLKRLKKPRTYPIIDHAIVSVLSGIQVASRQLWDLYADEDGLRHEELDFFAGKRSADGSRQNPEDYESTQWSNFYSALKNLKSNLEIAETTLASAPDVNSAAAAEALLQKDPNYLARQALINSPGLKLFRPSEGLGMRVDLQPVYNAFINLKRLHSWCEQQERQSEVARLTHKLKEKGLSEEVIKNRVNHFTSSFKYQPIEYSVYLRRFSDFRPYPRHIKYNCPEYVDYLKFLKEYLWDFLRRVNPLADHKELDRQFHEQFKGLWSAKRDTRSVSGIATWHPPTHTLELYCLPTDRLFINEGTLLAHKKSEKYKKCLTKIQSIPVEEQAALLSKSEEKDQIIALNEFVVERLAEVLGTTVERTVQYVQAKQSRTLRELEANSDNEEENIITESLECADEKKENVDSDGNKDDDDDDDIPVIYNPRNLPLGWDGKPIPYWLYQLHGLNVEYKCEICGNFSYFGRRNFERHFHEWRHSFGMKCLGIPNTAHFKEIVKIEDAVLLWEKLRRETQQDQGNEVEYEGPQGTVYTGKPTDDLERRQALLFF